MNNFFAAKYPDTRTLIVVTEPESLISWDENAPNDPASGKEKDRSIHVFTGKRHE